MTAAAARLIMRCARSAALATASQGNDGWPYASLVTVAVDCDAGPILLLSNLADHSRNLKEDDRASLLFENASGRVNPQTGPRVTVMGRVRPSADARHRRRFLARHPSAERYAGFGDFRFHHMTVERAHFVGGFARAQWIEGSGVLLDHPAATAVARAEDGILAHMNSDHAEAVHLFAHRLLGRRGDGWRLAAVDPEGCDLRRKGVVARLDFPRLADGVAELRRILVELVAEARSLGS